uniref:Synaptobrevin, longin-like domain protein n=1 Tax=Tanacetum cinerariifolium TaxID=118510 RepID=A0A6L2MNC7_TANCI|nr:synaptobrevin, longin-like domain protein [Tanacetum cinerariifolium]
MAAYLQKPEGSEEFHQIVYFLNTSHIRYALTENLTIYVSLIQQFWQTATTRTLDNREIEITATIDRKVRVVTEASVRRHLKLEDSNGISILPTTEIFDQLALMGYVSNSDKLTFQKGQFSPQYRFLIHIILHCLSSKKTAWEHFSSNIATALIYLATNRTFNFSNMIFDGMVKNMDRPKFSRSSIRQETKVHQPSSPTYTHVADEAASTGVDVRHGGVATNVTSLNAGQGSGNIDKTSSMPHDSSLLRVNILGSNEGRMKHNELMNLVTTLSDIVLALETDLKQTKKVYGAAYTKLIMKVKKLKNILKTSQARRKAKRKDKGKCIMEESESAMTKTKRQQNKKDLVIRQLCDYKRSLIKKRGKGLLEFMKQLKLLLRKNGKILEQELKLMKS